MTIVYIDADACPVKEETYKVAKRHELHVIVVANSGMRTPPEDWIELVKVEGGLDVADDWIAERATEGDVVVTNDIPLAARCLENGAAAIAPTGRKFDEDMIGDALATREIHSHLRDLGVGSGGPPPFSRKDRSQFLQNLEDVIRKAVRGF